MKQIEAIIDKAKALGKDGVYIKMKDFNCMQVKGWAEANGYTTTRTFKMDITCCDGIWIDWRHNK